MKVKYFKVEIGCRLEVLALKFRTYAPSSQKLTPCINALVNKILEV